MTTTATIGSHRRTAAPAERTISYDVLRIVAILGVVAIHTMGSRLALPPRDSTGWWVAAAMDVGSFWAVPVFVMISGALLLGGRADRDGPHEFYRRRLVRLVPAVVVWHVVYLVGVRWWLRDEPVDLGRAGVLLLDGQVFTGLYFLWVILGLYLVAPVLAAFLRGGGRVRACAVAGLALVWAMGTAVLPALTALAGTPRPYSITIWNEWMLWVGFFVAGYALRDVRVGRVAGVLVIGAAVAAFGIATWELNRAPDLPWLQAAVPVSYLGATVVLGSLAVFVGSTSLLDRWRPGRRSRVVVERLSASTLGVFLVHQVFIELTRVLRPDWAGPDTPTLLVLYAAVVPLSFAFALAVLRVPGLRRLI